MLAVPLSKVQALRQLEASLQRNVTIVEDSVRLIMRPWEPATRRLSGYELCDVAEQFTNKRFGTRRDPA